MKKKDVCPYCGRERMSKIERQIYVCGTYLKGKEWHQSDTCGRLAAKARQTTAKR